MEESKNLINEQGATEMPVAEPEVKPEPEQTTAPEETPAPEAAPATEAAPAPETPAPKKKKKKTGMVLGIIAGVVVLAIVVGILIAVLSGNKDFTRGAFINELGGVSETFVGAVSEYEYYSADEAAEDYVRSELSGNSYVTVNSVVSQGTVDPSGIIPAEFLEGSDLVEKYEVDFTRPSTASVGDGPQAVSMDESGENERVIVYVIRYGSKWRYYTPMPIKGQALNKSYYTSIFESDKYQNCTLEIVKTTKAGTFGLSVTNTEIKWIIKRQDNKLYFEQTISEKSFLKSSETVTAWYLEDSDGGEAKLYEKVGDGEWIYKHGYTLSFYNGLFRISEVSEYTPFFDQLHFSPDIFNKTDYGFEISEDKGREYFLDTYFWREFSRLMAENKFYFSDDDVEIKNMYAEYFIQNGALTGVRMNTEANFKNEIEGIEMAINYSGNYVAKITNYGTTVVESPVK